MNNQTLKGLTLFSLLIFFMPFIQTCSKDQSKGEKMVMIPSGTGQDSMLVSVDSLQNYEATLGKETIEKIRIKDRTQRAIQKDQEKGEFTLNAYQLSFASMSEFKLASLIDLEFYALLCYSIIVVSSLYMVFLAFKEQHKQVATLAMVNLVALLISTLLFCINGTIEDIDQLKYGFFVYFINAMLILLLSKKLSQLPSN